MGRWWPGCSPSRRTARSAWSRLWRWRYAAGAGRPNFGHTFFASTSATGLEDITAWLAELAQSALDVVLFVDEADHLPEASREVLAYLLRNAPPNLRVVLAARSECHLAIEDLVVYGQCALVGQEMLRLQLDETLELVHKRFGERIDNDAAARLHELTEGWPLGLQLALSAIGSGGDAQLLAIARSARGDALREQFVGLLLANLDPADAAFLTRVAIVDHVHADLCRVMVAAGDAGQRLARLARDTPVFVAVEGSDWLRMHSLARDVLRERFAALPEAERSTMHARAADWLAAHGLLEAAAGHALSAGQTDRAYELAERSLYESLMTRGHQSSVLEWLGRLPPEELDRRPQLLLAAAWSLALSERHEEAGRLVARLLAQPGVDDGLQRECALILSGAAVFADDPDRFAELHDPRAELPPLRDPRLLRIHANREAFRMLLEGDPALARLRRQKAPDGDTDAGLGYLSRWGDFIVGLTYLWEGQVLLAERVLRPALAQAEGELGRRDPFAAMLGALLAAAAWERNQPAEAAALLANRLDVLERSGLPEAVLLGYRTLARMATAEGAENRALELLGALHAAGVARRLPRLCVASLADQVRLHARRYRPETCRDLCLQIDTLLAEAGSPTGPAVAAQRRRAARAGLRPCRHRGAGLAPCARAPGACRRAGTAAEAGAAAHRAAGPARLRARPLWREVAGPAARGCRSGADLRAAAHLRRRAPVAGRLGAPGAARRAWRRARRRRAAGGADAGAARRGRNGPPALESEHGVDTQGARGAGAAGAQPLEQGDRAGDAGGRGHDQVAHEEPVRQARRRHAQAGGAARAHSRLARLRVAGGAGRLTGARSASRVDPRGLACSGTTGQT